MWTASLNQLRRTGWANEATATAARTHSSDTEQIDRQISTALFWTPSECRTVVWKRVYPALVTGEREPEGVEFLADRLDIPQQ